MMPKMGRSQSQLYQISHEQTISAYGDRIWAVSGDRTINALRAAGFRLDSRRVQTPQQTEATGVSQHYCGGRGACLGG